MVLDKWPSRLACLVLLAAVALSEDYNVQHGDGAYEFGYDAPDTFHHSQADRKNVVRGEFGGRNPKTGVVDVTQYTAGPRGYRPRGKNIHRKFDQNQNRRGPIGTRDDPYFDPNEDPSYQFGFKTRTHTRQEEANRVGDVKGKYSYVDDVGERHNVEYIAGKHTGFHVKTPFPDSNPRAYGPLFFRGRGKPIPRGRTSIQRGLDGSYRFVSTGPDQRRTEQSDASGNVRGSYTYLDDKGVQHSVHYIAGPQIGYRVLKNVKGPHLPSVFPFAGPNIVPSDFYDYIDKNTDVFDTAASGRPVVKPSGARPLRPTKKPSYYDEDSDDDDGGDLFNSGSGSTPRPPISSSVRPSYDDDEDDDSILDDGDLFNNSRPPKKGASKPTYDDSDDSILDDSNLFNNNRPPKKGASKPNYDDTDDDDSTLDDSNLFNNNRPPKKGSSKPTYDENDLTGDDANDDFGLFGSSTPKPPVINIGTSRPGGNKQHTIVTNVGDTVFTVPPGVSVKAHVQSIDLFPYESKVPSPSEQLRAEMSKSKEDLVVAATTPVAPTTVQSTTTLK